jgi:hypothetical protein
MSAAAIAQPKFSIVNELMKELLSQFSGDVVRAIIDAKVCDEEKARTILSTVAAKFYAEITLIRRQPKPQCVKCNDAVVSRHSKSHQYCYKCAKNEDDIAEEYSCIAPSKNSSGECGRKTYGSHYCTIHQKWGAANDKGKVCQYIITKGARKGSQCRSIISEDSKEEYCSKHSRQGKCEGTNSEGNPCQFNAVEGETLCQSHLNKQKKPSKKDEADAADEVVEEKKEKKQHKKKSNDD